MSEPTLDAVAASLAARIPMYRWRRPVYQWTMLAQLRSLWRAEDRRVLDVGGGTGVIAQAISELFPVDRVTSIDVAERFLDGLTIETRSHKGSELPFADGEFDCAVLNNMLHHVPVQARVELLRECRRVTRGGAFYLKDHLAASSLDHVRLAALDLIGNTPFHGMVRAQYLTWYDWQALAEKTGCRIEEKRFAAYRSGPMALAFPNRLEIAMRWSSAL